MLLNYGGPMEEVSIFKVNYDLIWSRWRRQKTLAQKKRWWALLFEIWNGETAVLNLLGSIWEIVWCLFSIALAANLWFFVRNYALIFGWALQAAIRILFIPGLFERVA